MGWTVVANDVHAPSCEDRTPYITIRCQCGQDHHLHRSSVPPTRTAGMTCERCGSLILLRRGWLLEQIRAARQ